MRQFCQFREPLSKMGLTDAWGSYKNCWSEANPVLTVINEVHISKQRF